MVHLGLPRCDVEHVTVGGTLHPGVFSTRLHHLFLRHHICRFHNHIFGVDSSRLPPGTSGHRAWRWGRPDHIVHHHRTVGAHLEEGTLSWLDEFRHDNRGVPGCGPCGRPGAQNWLGMSDLSLTRGFTFIALEGVWHNRPYNLVADFVLAESSLRGPSAAEHGGRDGSLLQHSEKLCDGKKREFGVHITQDGQN